MPAFRLPREDETCGEYSRMFDPGGIRAAGRAMMRRDAVEEIPLMLAALPRVAPDMLAEWLDCIAALRRW
jgi:hypothetical protein